MRIENEGLHVGRWFVPPFALGNGECVSLQFPWNAYEDRDAILAALTEVLKVTFVQPATPPTGWRRWFRDPTPFDWLRENTDLTDDAIRSILVEFEMQRPIPLSCYAANPRMILGLYAAYARKPAAIAFETSGLDPKGVRWVYQIIRHELMQCPAIYLAWPYSRQGQEHHPAFPGFLSLAVVDTGHAT